MDAPALRASRSVGTRLRLGRAQLALWRPTWSWVRGVVRSFATSFLALTASLWLLPGVQVERGAESVATLAVLALALGALLRPLITRLTVLTGVFGLLVAGLLAQAGILWLARWRAAASEGSIAGFMSPEQRGLLRETQLVMSLMEGFSDWVMDEVGEQVLPDVAGIRRRFEARRSQRRRGVDRIIARLTGLDLPGAS